MRQGAIPRGSTTEIYACAGKIRYRTFSAAEGSRRPQAARHRGHLQAYRCSFCQGFHLGRPGGSLKHRRTFKDEACFPPEADD